MKVKLYVWENVLKDYNSGIMFAYAREVDHARELIEKKMGFHHSDIEIEPREITKQEGFYILGGS